LQFSALANFTDRIVYGIGAILGLPGLPLRFAILVYLVSFLLYGSRESTTTVGNNRISVQGIVVKYVAVRDYFHCYRFLWYMYHPTAIQVYCRISGTTCLNGYKCPESQMSDWAASQIPYSLWYSAIGRLYQARPTLTAAIFSYCQFRLRWGRGKPLHQ